MNLSRPASPGQAPQSATDPAGRKRTVLLLGGGVAAAAVAYLALTLGGGEEPLPPLPPLAAIGGTGAAASASATPTATPSASASASAKPSAKASGARRDPFAALFTTPAPSSPPTGRATSAPALPGLPVQTRAPVPPPSSPTAPGASPSPGTVSVTVDRVYDDNTSALLTVRTTTQGSMSGVVKQNTVIGKYLLVLKLTGGQCVELMTLTDKPEVKSVCEGVTTTFPVVD